MNNVAGVVSGCEAPPAGNEGAETPEGPDAEMNNVAEQVGGQETPVQR